MSENKKKSRTKDESKSLAQSEKEYWEHEALVSKQNAINLNKFKLSKKLDEIKYSKYSNLYDILFQLVEINCDLQQRVFDLERKKSR